MNNQYVTKSLEDKLPKASNWPRISIYKFWWVQLWRWFKREVNQFGYLAPAPKLYFKIRGANFTTYYFGPIVITHRSRWLDMSARVLHPIQYKEYNDKI